MLSKKSISVRGASLLLGPLLTAAPAHAHVLDHGTRFLPFLNDTASGDRAKSPTLTLTVNGQSVPAVMDTGSTGVVVALKTMFPDWKSDAEIVGKIDAVLPAGSDASLPGLIDTTRLDFSKMTKIEYSSSGRIYYGIYVDRPVTVSGAASQGGTIHSITSTPVPVLAVIDEECVTNPRNCQPNHEPTGIGMLGIGYARQTSSDPYGTRTLNPFLNLDTPTSANGYVITTDGVKVGLDVNDLLQVSSTVARLEPNAGMAGEWLPPQATISLDGGAAVRGNVLLDTGLDTMLMTVPTATSAGLRIPVEGTTDSTLPSGTTVTIRLADTGGLPAGYRFDTSRTDGMAPASVTLVGNDGSKPDWKATFVNTGVRFLNGFDYVFDDTHGLVGFGLRGSGAW